MHLDGDITTTTFRTKSDELREAREGAQKELEASRRTLLRLEDMERSKEALVAHYASLVPEGLAELSSKEKNRIYKMMRLRVLAHRDDSLVAEWGCNDASTPLSPLDTCVTSTLSREPQGRKPALRRRSDLSTGPSPLPRPRAGFVYARTRLRGSRREAGPFRRPSSSGSAWRRVPARWGPPRGPERWSRRGCRPPRRPSDRCNRER